MTNDINDKACPFCKQNNHCMVDLSRACWCQNVIVPQELQQLLPIELQKVSCICAGCVASFKQDETAFKARYICLFN